MRSSALLAAGIILLDAARSVAAPSFTPLGFFPGDGRTQAWDISADGTTVVGEGCCSSGRQAFRWTASTGLQALEDRPGGNANSEAFGVSAHGEIVVGSASLATDFVSARWTPDGHIETIVPTSGPKGSLPWDVSDDGKTFVGVASDRAFVWNADTGFRSLGDLPGGFSQSSAFDVSADGRTVVGQSGSEYARTGEAFIWTDATGMVGIGDLGLSQFPSSAALGVSADGTTVVGWSNGQIGGQTAMLWTARDGMRNLDDSVSAFRFRRAQDVSDDGSIVVGIGDEGASSQAIVWTKATGAQRLDVMLHLMGVDTLGWKEIQMASAVSGDGTTIVGWGYNANNAQEAFIAVIPEPGTALLLGMGLACLGCCGGYRRL